jgi:uncharacterized RDD family membrane protein YckC/Tfp pilus assembly major pilin PilA
VLAFTAIGAFAASSSATEEASLAWTATFYLASWIIGWLYFAFLHSSERQASLGKRALGIKVVTPSGERIGFGRATGRYFAYLFNSIFTLGIGFVIAAFTARRQSLHDMMAGTLVVTRDASAKDVIAGLAEPKASGGVVAVAVVACLVPAVGVVAAIAIPAYQDYTIRSQVLEGLTLASSYKASVSAAYAGGTAFEEMTSESLGLEGPDGAYVDNIEVISGVVQVTYGGEAHQNLAGRTLLLVPAETDAGDLRWICGKASAPDDVAPAIDGWTQYTDVEGKYLPPTCRG